MTEKWRKINIDQYDEDVVLESELYDPDPRAPSTILADAKGKAQLVRSALSKGDTASALSGVLEGAPYGQNVDEAKILTLQSLLLVLNSTKPADITPAIKALSSDAQDTLMKYLYKGMAMPGYTDINGGVLLSWHEKLTDIAGTGCIVRVMTDRRIV